jgi:hypothetical protein
LTAPETPGPWPSGQAPAVHPISSDLASLQISGRSAAFAWPNAVARLFLAANYVPAEILPCGSLSAWPCASTLLLEIPKCVRVRGAASQLLPSALVSEPRHHVLRDLHPEPSHASRLRGVSRSASEISSDVFGHPIFVRKGQRPDSYQPGPTAQVWPGTPR